MSVEQLDMFAMLAHDEYEAKVRAAGIPRLYVGAARGLHHRLAEKAAWLEQWSEPVGRGYGLVHKGWTPDCTFLYLDIEVETCQAIVAHADLRCSILEHAGRPCYCVGALVHRGFCLACDWEADVDRGSDTEAALDALDHAHPGWRESPVVDEPKRDANTNHATKAWKKYVDEVYGERPQGWPIITRRSGVGHRAVAKRSPWGGYDVSSVSLGEEAAQ